MKVDVYKKCPYFENENYLIRLVNTCDAIDLLEVYSDKKSLPLFNSDNCHGDDFHYTSVNRLLQVIEYWLLEYKNKGFVRFSIIHKKNPKAIGTIELFHRVANDYFGGCGILRLDLKSDYEKKEMIEEILSLIVESSYSLFNCTMIATKAKPYAIQRRDALKALGFHLSKELLVTQSASYDSYYVKNKQ